MRFHRLFWMSGFVVLAGGLLQFAGAQSVEPRYLPAGTDVVVTFNVEQMLNSEVAKSNKELVNKGKTMLDNTLSREGVQKYLDKAGLDLTRDLKSISVALPGKDAEKGLLIVEGRFDPAKMKSAAEEAAKENQGSITVTKIGDQTCFEIPQQNGKTVFVTVLSKDVILGSGDRDVLAKSIAQAKSGDAAKLPKGFATLLDTTSDKQTFSAVATGSALAAIADKAPVANANAAAKMLKDIEGASFAVTLTKNVNFQLGINAAGKEAAKQMAESGEAGLAFVKTMAAQKAKDDPKLEPLADVAKTLRVVTQGNNVVLRGEVSYENLSRIMKIVPKKALENDNQ